MTNDKQLKLVQRFRGRSHSAKKVKKADKRMRTIAGILLREILRNLPEENPYKELLDTCMKFVNGEKYDGHKIYSLHEPDVLCIGKGKDHVKYEFGNKVSITRLWNGTIIGAMSFRNEYDGHTIDRAMEQVERIFGRPLKSLAGDRGYRGQKHAATPISRFPQSQSRATQPMQDRRSTSYSARGRELSRSSDAASQTIV